MGDKINASTAYQMAIKQGFDVSYPRFLKWLKDNNMATQPTGAGGDYIIDQDKMARFLKDNRGAQLGGRQGRPPKKEEL